MNALPIRQSRSLTLSAVLGGMALLASLPACSGMTHYTPRAVARGELTLRYDNEFQLYAGGQRVATGYTYGDLPDFVRCVPSALRHAEAARSDGAAGVTLTTLGITLGVGGMGGLAGLAFYDSNPDMMFALLGGGIITSIAGVVLSGVSRTYKNNANGHAVDAMNYYNDAVGSYGASCNDLVYPEPAGPEPSGPAAPVPDPANP